MAALDGSVSIRRTAAGETECYLLQDSKDWIEVVTFSPDGALLAVGSHDTNVYLYDTSNWTLKKTLEGHCGYVNALDWSADSSYLRTNCSSKEILFWCGAAGWTLDGNGKYNTVATEWATNNTKYGWHTTGIVPAGYDHSHVNTVAGSEDETLLVTGDDNGLINIFRNPAKEGHVPRSFRGHSDQVMRVLFAEEDGYIFSVGGYD